ncbi:hypothetical protein [Pseudoduganella lutea]|uniref:Uncharacterized protein n=1 Tax=Pseudoduganella lutea TaxID=321985 RepID=A0A4P6KSB4_9BURK|nr:hypothetical protein [Pseudoduganella lutea]QBE61740.1 hypothetical protein EWM63_00950 [Pseudoduganella lutea]
MNIEEVIRFLGLPAQSREFDEYLTAHGISHRPEFKETPVDDINIEAAGLSLVFDSANIYESMYGTLQEQGSMIFSSLQVYSAANDSGFQQYGGPLPYGLSFESTPMEAMTIFGTPTVKYTFSEEPSYVWHDYNGNTIGVTFLGEEKGISWLELSRAEKEPPEQMDFD